MILLPLFMVSKVARYFCQNCGYEFENIDPRIDCKECGCNRIIVDKPLNPETIHFSDKITEITTKSTKKIVNPLIQSYILIISLFALVIGYCFRSGIAIGIGIILDILLYVIGKNETKIVTEINHYKERL